jgi:hypothetical protein
LMSAKSFFEKYLRPNFEEWTANPIDERRAMNAILSLSQMTDWFYHENKSDLSKIASAKNLNDFREQLIQNKCSDFQYIWDVADAHKHFVLDRRSAKVKKADDVSVQKTSYFAEDYAAEEYSQDEDELVVDIGDGDLRSVMGYAQNVYKMWECILQC